MLQRLYVDNYKCLINFDLPLQELSLLLGPNGVGKTSVLDVVFALRQFLDGVARITDDEAFPTRTLTRWQKRDVQIFEIEVLLDHDTFIYRLEVEHDCSTRRARVILEKLTHRDNLSEGTLFEFERGEVRLRRDNYSLGPQYTFDWSESALARVAPRNDNRRLTRFLDFIKRIMVCSLYPPAFRTESSGDAPLLTRDSRNFSDWYRHVMQERPELISPFTTTLQEILPGLRSIRLEKAGQETRALMAAFDEDGERYELRFDELSDGQRALIALYALVHLTADQGYTLFLDEPENYVALPEIQPWLTEIRDACGDTIAQTVICSHHPELIDYLGSENSYTLQREKSGVVTVRKTEASLSEPGLRLSELIARGWVS